MTQPPLGVMLLDTQFPRIPGDVGNTASYDFPVLLKTVPGATVQRVVFEADPALREAFVEAARELESADVAAITSSCGFLSVIQEAVSSAVSVPVFLSSLMQVPMAHAVSGGRIAIVTANANRLTDKVLAAAGITTAIPYVVAGMEDVPAFSAPILYDGAELDRAQIEREMVAVAEKLTSDHPDVTAFVFECHNLAPYGRAVQAATGLPVFDVIDFAHWVYGTTNKREFER
jgi:Asp/Glu/hydantoin racemase